MNAGRYERKEEREGYRNGYSTRELYTRVWGLTLRVPRDREGAFSTQLFERYQRSEKALVLALQESYLQGVSTRKVKKITEKLCGVSFSKDQVSRMAQALDGELGAWRGRKLDKRYLYLIADARYQYVRVDGQVENEGILKVEGIDQEGSREVLSVSLVPGEEKASWDKVLSDLLDRGLDPRAVRLVVSDEHKGLKAALQRYLPKATWQRCQTHYQCNAGAKVPRKARKEIHAGLRDVFNAPDHERARARAQQLIQEWGQRFPELTDWIEETIEDVLQVFTLPEEHQRRLRTTNSLERLHRESALMMEQSEEWLTGHRYLTMKVLEEEPIAVRIENPIPLKIPSR